MALIIDEWKIYTSDYECDFESDYESDLSHRLRS